MNTPALSRHCTAHGSRREALPPGCSFTMVENDAGRFGWPTVHSGLLLVPKAARETIFLWVTGQFKVRVGPLSTT